MHRQEVNELALRMATEAIVGTQVTELIEATYTIIDKAMREGYALGKYDAEINIDAQTEEAFDNGYELGASREEESICDRSWDEGYLEGVGDARARPWVADETIVSIISDMAEMAFNGEYDPDNVQDSGDEQVRGAC